METEQANKKTKNNPHHYWIKFLISCFIFLLSFTYLSDNVYRLFPLNYFESPQYSSSVAQFMHWFCDLKIEFPEANLSLEQIPVSAEEILDAKISSHKYSEYLYNNESEESTSISSLTDDEIKEIIRYDKYINNQQELEHYNTYNYGEQNAFYYDLVDKNGVRYSNLPAESVPTLDTIKIPYNGKNQDNFYETNNYARQYGLIGTLYLPKQIMGQSTIQNDYQQFMQYRVVLFIVIIITVISCFPVIHYLKKINLNQIQFPEKLKWIEEKYLTLPIELKAIFFLYSLFTLQNFSPLYYWNISYLLSHWIGTLIRLVFILIIIYLFIFQLKGLIYLLQHPKLIQKEWKKGIYHTNKDDLKNLPVYRKVFTKVVLYTIFIGAWGIMIGISLNDLGYMFIVGLPSIALALILLVMIKNRTKTIQAITDNLEQMAHGNNTSDIPVKGDGLIADIANNINIVREGVIISNQKQTNSERLKTELITNVSHDLRTPLTSILNYVDLAKRDNITNEERQEYIEIIDKKSKRLKVLIDDLFEASKMASGAVELYKEQVDLVSLMHQSLAEYEDRFTENHLTLRTKTTDQHMYAYCDGRKMYRVFENLLSNVIKYAQPGTRVYLEMLYEGSEIVITLKNISNYELGFDIVELTERFKRADSSRHTEGSGLGLSIVKSILDLHGAIFELSQDGDLFKVTIKMKKL